jgi:ElaB/YqjD/DUF883 family membrane-anchored ribosome-binding protein
MKNNKGISHSAEELLSELQSIVSEAETMVSESVSEHSAAAISALRERFGEAQERFTAAYDEVRKKAIAGARSADAAIRDNPYQALAIALGVGVVVGALIGRRSK